MPHNNIGFYLKWPKQGGNPPCILALDRYVNVIINIENYI